MKRIMTACLAGLLACCALAPQRAAALDLAGALRDVAAANPTVAARRARVEAAERRVAPAGAWQSPEIELGVVNVPTTGSFDTDPMTMKVVGVTQRVPLFGSHGLARESARQAVAAEGAGTEVTLDELYGAAWTAYADAYFAGALADLADSHRGVVDRLVESARVRYQSGNGRLEEVLSAEAERARAMVDLAAFGAEARAAQAQLGALRGADPAVAAESLAEPPLADVPVTPEPWLAAVAPSHPRLRELDAEVGRDRYAAKAARRTAWPDLELKGSYGWRETLASGIPQDDLFSATVGFTVPIFAAQREHSEGAELDARARAGESERRAAELELRREVVATHAAAAAAQRAVHLLADTVVATQRQAMNATWSAYRAGAADLWRVFEVTHSVYAEEVALVRARQDLARAEGRLLSLTGRGDLLGVTLPVAKEGGR